MLKMARHEKDAPISGKFTLAAQNAAKNGYRLLAELRQPGPLYHIQEILALIESTDLNVRMNSNGEPEPEKAPTSVAASTIFSVSVPKAAVRDMDKFKAMVSTVSAKASMMLTGDEDTEDEAILNIGPSSNPDSRLAHAYAGDTLLLTAIRNNHAQAVEALLARGVNPNEKNDAGVSPLFPALAISDKIAVMIIKHPKTDLSALSPDMIVNMLTLHDHTQALDALPKWVKSAAEQIKSQPRQPVQRKPDFAF
jgi:hypothetical protein